MQQNIKNLVFADFCRNVKRLRRAHKLTQQELADIMGIEKAAARRLEAGIVPQMIRSSALLHLAQYFQLELYQLFLPDGQS